MGIRGIIARLFDGMAAMGRDPGPPPALTLEDQLDRELFTCGRREGDGMDNPESPFTFVPTGRGIDRWQRMPNGDRTCSYCGSLCEPHFLEIIEAYARGEPGYQFDLSDKGYKRYANRPGVRNASEGGIKFYGWHADLTPGPELDRKQGIMKRARERSAEELAALMKKGKSA